jgi:hypothetical protein
MAISRNLRLLTLICFLVQLSHSQNPVPTKRDGQAIRLLTQCAAAMGSPALDSAVLATGKSIPAYAEDPSAELVLKSKGETKMRWEMNSAGSQEAITLNSGRGRSTRNGRGNALPAWQTKYTRQEHFPAMLCVSEFQRPNTDILYLGEETVGNTSAHHIKISVATNGKSQLWNATEAVISEFHIFLDSKSFVVVKTMRYAFSPDAIENRSKLENYYSNYQSVNGTLMPFTITTFLDGQKLRVISFDHIQLDPVIGDGEFDQ